MGVLPSGVHVDDPSPYLFTHVGGDLFDDAHSPLDVHVVNDDVTNDNGTPRELSL